MSVTSPVIPLLGLLTLVVPLMGVLMALTPYLMPKRECFAVTVPDDAALFLPERFGIGWTINLGRPAAWAFVVGFALVIAGFIAASFLLT